MRIISTLKPDKDSTRENGAWTKMQISCIKYEVTDSSNI